MSDPALMPDGADDSTHLAALELHLRRMHGRLQAARDHERELRTAPHPADSSGWAARMRVMSGATSARLSLEEEVARLEQLRVVLAARASNGHNASGRTPVNGTAQ